MQFKDVPGQEKVKKQLLTSVQSGRISHAQLFLGPEGCGNLALAIAYSQYIACSEKTETDSCGHCNSCIKYEKLIHPDLHFAFPISSTKEISGDVVSSRFLNKWRELILENCYFNLFRWLEFIGIENKQGIISVEESNEILKKLLLKPYESEYKTMIIWLPEKLHASAANKLLKIIEEPPDKTLFILVSHFYEGILKTILSRTLLIKIPKFDDGTLAGYVLNFSDCTPEAARKKAHLADGNMFRLLNLLHADTNENYSYRIFRKWLQLAWKYDVPGLFDWLDEVTELGREKQKHLLEYGTSIMRETQLLQAAGGILNKSTDEELEFISRLAPVIRKKLMHEISGELDKAYYHIGRNVHPRTVFFDLSVKLSDLMTQAKSR